MGLPGPLRGRPRRRRHAATTSASPSTTATPPTSRSASPRCRSAASPPPSSSSPGAWPAALPRRRAAARARGRRHAIGNHGMRHRAWRGLDDAGLPRSWSTPAPRSRTPSAPRSTRPPARSAPTTAASLAALRRLGYRRVYTSDRGTAAGDEFLQARNTHRPPATRPACWTTSRRRALAAPREADGEAVALRCRSRSAARSPTPTCPRSAAFLHEQLNAARRARRRGPRAVDVPWAVDRPNARVHAARRRPRRRRPPRLLLRAHDRRARPSASATSAPGACSRSTASTACACSRRCSRQDGYHFTDLSPSGNVVGTQRAARLQLARHRRRRSSRTCPWPSVPGRDAISADPAGSSARSAATSCELYRDHAARAAARHVVLDARRPRPATSSSAGPPQGPAAVRLDPVRRATPSCSGAMAAPARPAPAAAPRRRSRRWSSAGSSGAAAPVAHARRRRAARCSAARPRARPDRLPVQRARLRRLVRPIDERSTAAMRTQLHHLVAEAAHREPRRARADVQGRHRRPTPSCGDEVAAFGAGAAPRSGCARGDRVGDLPRQADRDGRRRSSARRAAGGVFVPVNPLLKARQVGLHPRRLRRAGPGHDAPSASRCCATELADVPGARARRRRRRRRRGDGARRVRGPRAGRADRRAGAVRAAPRIDVDMAAILYTSGSTGKPEGRRAVATAT